MASSVIPTLKDELDRKTFETIEYLVGAVHKGRMTKAQVSAALDTLFMAVSGLVDNDFIDIITEAQNVVGNDKSVVKRHFYDIENGVIFTISWMPGTTEITTCSRLDGMATGGSLKSCDSVATAGSVFNDCGRAFEKEGYVEL